MAQAADGERSAAAKLVSVDEDEVRGRELRALTEGVDGVDVAATGGTTPLPNWTLEHSALTDHSGTMTFYDTPRVMTRGFACLEGTYEPKDRIPHQVEVVSLDDYCGRRNIGSIAFLKLDIEGSELKALKGASGMLAKRAIRTILVETTLLPHTRDLTQEIDDLLRKAGYRSFRALRNGGLVPIDVMAQKELREDILWRLSD